MSDEPKERRARWLRCRRIRWARVTLAVAAVFAAYVASYGLGDFTFDYVVSTPSVQTRYRKFSYDPWIYIPLAKFECGHSPRGTVVVLERVDGKRTIQKLRVGDVE